MPKFYKNNAYINSRKVLKNIKKHNIQNVVLSKEIEKNDSFKNYLIDNKKYIITGYRMGKVLLSKMLHDISKYMKVPVEKMKVTLLMNEYSIENINLIEYISRDVKQLSLLSKNYKKYERIANRLFDDYGYMVKLYDNDVKELKRENIIINIDFKENEINDIFIPREAIIISLNEKINELKRNFNGIIVNDLDILAKEEVNNNFRKLALCEANLYKAYRRIEENEMAFNLEKYMINGYIGRNGKITSEEFECIGKIILDKYKVNR